MLEHLLEELSESACCLMHAEQAALRAVVASRTCPRCGSKLDMTKLRKLSILCTSRCGFTLRAFMEMTEERWH